MIRVAGFAAVHLALIGVFAAAAWGAGRTLTARRLAFASRVESAAMSTVLGFGVLSTVFFVLAAVRLLKAPVVAAVLAAGCALAWRERRRVLDGFRRIGAKILAAIVLLPLVYFSLFPPLDPDTTMYHLPAARAFARSGAMPALPDLRYPVFPQLAELLDAAGMLLGGDVLTPLTSLLFCLLVAALLVAWGRRLGDLRAGAWSAALWLGSPFVLLLARSGLVEPATAVFTTAALVAMQASVDGGGAAWLAAAGALAGWAAGTKYTGLYFVAALLLAALALSPHGARVRGAAAFALGALAAGGPWYVRNLLLSGNPVWPFLGTIFGYRFWEPIDVASVTWTLRHEGGPQTFRALLALPWNLATGRQPGVRSLVPGLFALFPIGVVWGLASRSRRWLVLVTIGFIVFWFATTQQIRFLIPAVPAICLLTACGFSVLSERLLPLRRSAATAALTATAVVLGVALVPRELAGKIVRRDLPPVDEASRATYFSSRLPSYPLYRRLNAEHGGRYTIYAFHDETMKYFCEGRHLGDWFGLASYGRMNLSSGSALLRSLQQLGADHLLVNDSYFPTRLPQDDVFAAHFEEIFRSGAIRAFRVR
ncbi:MAG TPA: glycosyltransferase family 39 protein [Thermoanaerobaculia bacterium]|nr:glycosyltransferase family 39 protein [Thermoanaerobaculia bacterium]